jgi:hypothetical protein
MLAEGEQPKAAKYTKRDVSVVCIIGACWHCAEARRRALLTSVPPAATGGPAAGKSTQMQNIVKRFGLTQVKGAYCPTI